MVLEDYVPFELVLFQGGQLNFLGGNPTGPTSFPQQISVLRFKMLQEPLFVWPRATSEIQDTCITK